MNDDVEFSEDDLHLIADALAKYCEVCSPDDQRRARELWIKFLEKSMSNGPPFRRPLVIW